MPNPKNYKDRDSFMKACIPMTQREGTAKNPDQAVAICSSMWANRNKHKHMFTLDAYEDNALVWSNFDTEEVNFDESLEKEVYPAVCLIGDRIYKGNFLSAKELEKSFGTMDGTFHDLNHWSTSYPSGLFSQPNIEYVVGYQDGTTYDSVNKLMKTNIHIEDTAAKAQTWRGFMNICKRAHRTPNVSVTFWAGRQSMPVKDLPEGVDYKSYGLTEDDNIDSLVDLEFHALASVFRGACDDKAGCGIGIKYDGIKIDPIIPDYNSITVSYDSYTIPDGYYGHYTTTDSTNINNIINMEKLENLKRKILKELIKKEELSNGR